MEEDGKFLGRVKVSFIEDVLNVNFRRIRWFSAGLKIENVLRMIGSSKYAIIFGRRNRKNTVSRVKTTLGLKYQR